MITQKVCVEQRLKPCISLDLPSCAISVFTPTWGLIPKEIFQWLPGSKMLRMVWTRSVLPAPEISLSKERWWSGETEEMKDREKKIFFFKKKTYQDKNRGRSTARFPWISVKCSSGLSPVLSFQFGEKKTQNMPCWNKEIFHPFSVFPKLFSLLFSQTAFWMLTKFLTYSDPLKS